MTTPTMPTLLAAAARLLDQAGEIPPVCVTCNQTTRALAPITVTPASLAMPPPDQIGMAETAAAAMGWGVRPFDDAQSVIAEGTVNGIDVAVIAAPMTLWPGEPLTRTTGVTTAEHAALLRALIDWSAALPPQASVLEIREDLDNADGLLTARLVLTSQQAADHLPDVVFPAADDGWSGYRGAGILPTGHPLTISVGT